MISPAINWSKNLFQARIKHGHMHHAWNRWWYLWKIIATICQSHCITNYVHTYQFPTFAFIIYQLLLFVFIFTFSKREKNNKLIENRFVCKYFSPNRNQWTNRLIRMLFSSSWTFFGFYVHWSQLIAWHVMNIAWIFSGLISFNEGNEWQCIVFYLTEMFNDRWLMANRIYATALNE